MYMQDSCLLRARLRRFAGPASIAFLLFLAGCAGLMPGANSSGDTRAASDRPAANETPTRGQIAEVQRLLTLKGYDPGPVDGYFGRKTAAAIEQYRHERGLNGKSMSTKDLIVHLKGQPVAAPNVVAVEAATSPHRYDVGERYVFGGGITHDVVEISAGRVKWKTSEGETFSTSPEIGLPDIEWEYGTWMGRNKSMRDREAPWPPAEGRSVTFAVRSEEWSTDAGKNPPRQKAELHWTCETSDGGNIEVPAGAFAVTVIACERWPVPAGDWQKRVWYFAPAIGHYVRRDDLDTAGLTIESLELVAALPGGGGGIQKGLRGVLRDTLSNRAVNDPAVWNSPAGAGKYVVRVTRDFKGEAGRRCRAYTVSRADAARRRDFPAVSCFDKNKNRWRVPGL